MFLSSVFLIYPALTTLKVYLFRFNQILKINWLSVLFFKINFGFLFLRSFTIIVYGLKRQTLGCQCIISNDIHKSLPGSRVRWRMIRFQFWTILTIEDEIVKKCTGLILLFTFKYLIFNIAVFSNLSLLDRALRAFNSMAECDCVYSVLHVRGHSQPQGERQRSCHESLQILSKSCSSVGFEKPYIFFLVKTSVYENGTLEILFR